MIYGGTVRCTRLLLTLSCSLTVDGRGKRKKKRESIRRYQKTGDFYFSQYVGDKAEIVMIGANYGSNAIYLERCCRDTVLIPYHYGLGFVTDMLR